MKNRIVRLNEVKAMTGLSRSTIYAQIAKGNFPKQVQLTGARSIGWYEHAIEQWLASRESVQDNRYDIRHCKTVQDDYTRVTPRLHLSYG